MQFMKKLATAFRGAVREQGEALVDAQGLLIFEQEIIDAEQSAVRARAELGLVIAERKQLQRQLEKQQRCKQELEDKARQLLATGSIVPAEAVGSKLLTLQEAMLEGEMAIDDIRAQETRMTDSLRSVLQQIQQYRLRLSLAKSMARSQSVRMQGCAGNSGAQQHLAELKTTFQRLQTQQLRNEDRLAAMHEADDRLDNDGLGGSLQAMETEKRKLAVAGLLQQLQQTNTARNGNQG
jgi:phage shock protein A